MSASSYKAFDAHADADDGTTTRVAGQTVRVYDVTHAAALTDTETDAYGVVPGAEVAVAAGTLLRFAVTRSDGRKNYAEQLTT